MQTLGVWMIAIVIVIVGSGIIFEIDQLTTTVRLTDISCFE